MKKTINKNKEINQYKYEYELLNVGIKSVCLLQQVADILVYNLTHNGRLPNEVPFLTECLFEHINLSIEQVYVQRAIESQRLASDSLYLPDFNGQLHS